jgi:hypothetical protein
MVDEKLLRGVSSYHRYVRLPYLLVAKRARQATRRFRVQGKDHDPGSSLVEPMYRMNVHADLIAHGL